MYVISSPRINIVSKLRWYLTNDILKYIRQLREDLLVGRRTPIHYVNNITTSAPFSMHQRFPEREVYICEGIGFWNDRLQQIQLYVSTLSCLQRLSPDHPRVHSSGDAELLLFRLIDDCLQAYEAAEGFVDRQVFEERYGLMWDTTKQNNDKFE